MKKLPGVGVFIHQNHGTGGGNGSIMVGMFVCLCLASQNPFEWEFFVPTRMDLGVKLLRMDWLTSQLLIYMGSGGIWSTSDPSPPSNIIIMMCCLPLILHRFDGSPCFDAWGAIRRSWPRALLQGFINISIN